MKNLNSHYLRVSKFLRFTFVWSDGMDHKMMFQDDNTSSVLLSVVVLLAQVSDSSCPELQNAIGTIPTGADAKLQM